MCRMQHWIHVSGLPSHATESDIVEMLLIVLKEKPYVMLARDANRLCSGFGYVRVPMEHASLAVATLRSYGLFLDEP